MAKHTGQRLGLGLLATGLLLASATESAFAHRARRDPGICEAQILTDTLATAVPGDVVRVGNCTVEAKELIVPAGVTLTGSRRSRLTVPFGFLGVGLETAEGLTTKLSWLEVRSEGTFAVQVIGDGTAVIDLARFRIQKGVAIGAQSAADVRIKRSALTGMVKPSNAASVPDNAAIDEYSTHGIVMSQVGNVDIDLVSVRGFARYGVLLVESDSQVRRSWISNNVVVGAMVHGGHADFRFTRISKTFRGALPEDEHAAGLVVAAGAMVNGMHSMSSRNEGWGVFEDGAGPSTFTGLIANKNTMGGVFAQGSDTVELRSALLARNGFAGVTAINTTYLSVEDSVISGTSLASLQDPPPGIVVTPFSAAATPASLDAVPTLAAFAAPPTFSIAGDGIHLSNTAAFVGAVQLVNNERAGFFADLGASQSEADVTFDSASVSGTGSYGALFQQLGAPVQVAAQGIDRAGPFEQLDQAWFIGGAGIDVAGVQEPCFLPEPILLLERGIVALFVTFTD